MDETIDGTDADPGGRNFKYDKLGRLTQARVKVSGVTHVLDYGFATPNGCSPQSAPGLNNNRSSLTDTVAGNPPTVTTTGTATTTPTDWSRAPTQQWGRRPPTATATP